MPTLRNGWLTAGRASLLIVAACERQPRYVDGKAPLHTATIDIQPHAFDVGGDLRRRIDVVSSTHGLKAVVVMEMATSEGNDVTLRIDEPNCLSFDVVLRGSVLDPIRVGVRRHTYAHDCKSAPDPEAFWLALLETARGATGVAGVRDGVLEFEPVRSKSVEEYNRDVLANAKPGQPVEVYVMSERKSQ